MLLTFIKLSFALKTFVLSFLSGCLRQVLLYISFFCLFTVPTQAPNIEPGSYMEQPCHQTCKKVKFFWQVSHKYC